MGGQAHHGVNPMPPLHLTEENRECIRALVRQITPDFEEQLWEKVNLRRHEAERQIKEAAEQMARLKSWQQQQGLASQWGIGSTTPIFTSVTAATTTAPVYQSTGTGFSTYGPVDPLQGLNLKK